MNTRLRWDLYVACSVAADYSNAAQLRSEYNGAYEWLRKNGCIRVALTNMKPKWTRDLCVTDAMKYNRIVDWSRAKGGGYRYAYRNDLLNEIKKLVFNK